MYPAWMLLTNTATDILVKFTNRTPKIKIKTFGALITLHTQAHASVDVGRTGKYVPVIS